ncbi:hypothetical protein Atai01_14060 [Amycolatopsis taiwanensis]|uniref:Uncharacterized protein n=1 Tax=Amycolatopsis taiwanensis TaxID=342230 RepID=A0A9W6QZA8_9PSEU|nr:hypothetical protein Atai01_14060 [Amycolatopsis taiwanensis]
MTARNVLPIAGRLTTGQWPQLATRAEGDACRRMPAAVLVPAGRAGYVPGGPVCNGGVTTMDFRVLSTTSTPLGAASLANVHHDN